MKQTAMQEMIKKLEEKRDMFKAGGKLSDRQIRGTYVSAILIAKELLEMEKEQIIEARQDGYESTYAEYGETPKCYLDGTSEQYYNDTFNK